MARDSYFPYGYRPYGYNAVGYWPFLVAVARVFQHILDFTLDVVRIVDNELER